MNRYLILGIIATILVSGCVSQTGTVITSGGYGLEITEFSTDATDVYSGQTTHPTLTVENQGDATVYKTNSLALLIAPLDWEIIQGPSGAKDGKKVAEFKNTNIDHANPVTGSSAETDTLRWTLKSPGLDAGKEREDVMIAKIYYDYKTSSDGKIWLYTDSDRENNDNKLSSGTFSSSRGPISVDVSVIPDPPIAEYLGQLVTLQILVTNVGDGIPYSPGLINSQNYSIPENYRNNITIDIFPGTKSSLKVVNNSCPREVLLINGKATIACDLNITSLPSAKQSFPVEVVATYGYTTEQELSVKLTGK